MIAIHGSISWSAGKCRCILWGAMSPGSTPSQGQRAHDLGAVVVLSGFVGIQADLESWVQNREGLGDECAQGRAVFAPLPFFGDESADRFRIGLALLDVLDDHRLERRGWIRPHWGTSDNNRRARYYVLTRAGRRQLHAAVDSWRTMTVAVSQVLDMT